MAEKGYNVGVRVKTVKTPSKKPRKPRIPFDPSTKEWDIIKPEITKKTIDKSVIYDYQKPVFDKLIRTAIAHNVMTKENLPVKPRFHKLIIGMSGSGKSHLAEKVGETLNWDVMKINVASWIVLGARESPTWGKIVTWLADGSNAPKLLILDEIDKIDSSDSWTKYVRAEIFDLLDRKITIQTVEHHMDLKKAANSIKKLLVFACGAFQEAFETKDDVGFNSKNNTPTSSQALEKYIQRELVNRFDSDILILPSLEKQDYERMISSMKDHLKDERWELFNKFSIERIDEAIKSKSNARFVENILAQVYYHITEEHEIKPYEPFQGQLEEKLLDEIDKIT